MSLIKYSSISQVNEILKHSCHITYFDKYIKIESNIDVDTKTENNSKQSINLFCYKENYNEEGCGEYIILIKQMAELGKILRYTYYVFDVKDIVDVLAKKGISTELNRIKLDKENNLIEMHLEYQHGINITSLLDLLNNTTMFQNTISESSIHRDIIRVILIDINRPEYQNVLFRVLGGLKNG